MVKIGVPSKGRLMEKTFEWFGARGLRMAKSGADREYAGVVEGVAGVELAWGGRRTTRQRPGVSVIVATVWRAKATLTRSLGLAAPQTGTVFSRSRTAWS